MFDFVPGTSTVDVCCTWSYYRYTYNRTVVGDGFLVSVLARSTFANPLSDHSNQLHDKINIKYGQKRSGLHEPLYFQG